MCLPFLNSFKNLPAFCWSKFKMPSFPWMLREYLTCLRKTTTQSEECRVLHLTSYVRLLLSALFGRYQFRIFNYIKAKLSELLKLAAIYDRKHEEHHHNDNGDQGLHKMRLRLAVKKIQCAAVARIFGIITDHLLFPVAEST